jgi:hypothetical protein
MGNTKDLMATRRRSGHSEPSGSHVANVARSETSAQKPVRHMSVPDSTSQHLDYLREAYVYKVNAALERGHEDLAAELAEDYLGEVSSALEVASHLRG